MSTFVDVPPVASTDIRGPIVPKDPGFSPNPTNRSKIAVPGDRERLELSRSRDQLRLLFEVSEAIAAHGDLTALFRDLARRLPPVVPFEVIALFLHDPEKNVMRVHMLGTAEAD